MMKLFKHKTVTQLNECNMETLITTPLGIVGLSLYNDNLDILSQTPQFSKCLLHGGQVYGWEEKNIIVEIVISKPPIRIPETMKIENSRGILIRLFCKTDNMTLSFLTYWSKREWEDGGSDTGQFLQASTWNKGSMRLSIGTEDSEYLEQRMMNNWLMPIRKSDSYNLTGSNEDGLEIDLPNIRANELCQFHVFIAWGSSSDRYDASTWYAVDQDSKQILEFEDLL
ncbi:hypothetical protein [Paenibacillus sp.]|uniref:hypothetical protein n=1 Tax=Paenibacillus sp. TaxID=58172 RepID=UPI0028ADC15A|nr:hypothetical protein [Paenibacillus sp.]